MSEKPCFKAAHAYEGSVLALPVADLDTAARWYSHGFGMTEVVRQAEPEAAVILERDGIRMGFAVNGGDPAQAGAAIFVSGIHAIKEELESRGVKTGDWREDERDGEKLLGFFVIAPDELCYYFHEPV